MESTTLIIPCFNEADRLNFAPFEARKDIQFLFVNDGSTDNTTQVIQEAIAKNQSDHMELLSLEQNSGKAQAVRKGVLHLTENQSGLKETQWVGFWDADLATPLEEIDNFFRYKELNGDVVGLWGSRVYRLGASIRRSLKRHIFGRLFAWSIKFLLNVDAYDTQCGAKVFHRSILQTAFEKPFISRWIFDVEILLRIGPKRLLECPVKSWIDVEGSKLNVAKVSLRILKDLFSIRSYYTDEIRSLNSCSTES